MNTYYRPNKSSPWQLITKNVARDRALAVAKAMHAEPITHGRDGMTSYIICECPDNVGIKLTENIFPGAK